MKYYMFKVGIKNGVDIRTYSIIKESDLEYITYNNFLRVKYLTNIDENDDYIAMSGKNEATMILCDDQFDQREIESVFEILYDSLYMNGEDEHETSVNY